MSAKYGIAFSADMKSYPGKLWTVTAQNSNKPGLHTSNIAGAVDREDLHQIPILTVIFTSVSVGSTPRFDEERPKRLWHVTPGPLFDTSKTGGEVTVSCVNKSLIRFSVNMTLMGVFTYKRNAWQTQRKWLYAHAIFHWSEMKTYQTALSGKYSFSEFSSTPWQKNICLLGWK